MLMRDAQDVARALIDLVDNTDGVVEYKDGTVAPSADPTWTDLGQVYLGACRVLGVEPKIEQSEFESADDYTPGW